MTKIETFFKINIVAYIKEERVRRLCDVVITIVLAHDLEDQYSNQNKFVKSDEKVVLLLHFIHLYGVF